MRGPCQTALSEITRTCQRGLINYRIMRTECVYANDTPPPRCTVIYTTSALRILIKSYSLFVTRGC